MMRTLAARHTVQARAPLTTGVFPLWVGEEGLRGGEGKWTEGDTGDIRRLCLLIIVMVSGNSVLRGIHFYERTTSRCMCDSRREKAGQEGARFERWGTFREGTAMNLVQGQGRWRRLELRRGQARY